MTKHYVKIKGFATLVVMLSNYTIKTVSTLVTGYGYLHRYPASIRGMMDDEWFELEDKTVEVCYPDEFLVRAGDVWVELDNGITIDKILEVTELSENMEILEYED